MHDHDHTRYKKYNVHVTSLYIEREDDGANDDDDSLGCGVG